MRGTRLFCLASLLLTGCQAFQGPCGGGSCLRDRHVVSFEFMEPRLTLCPGDRFQLEVVARLDNGMVLRPGSSSWSVNRAGLDVSTLGPIAYDAKTYGFSVPADPTRFTGAPLGVRIAVRDRPDLPPVQVPVSIRYDCHYESRWWGARGADGAAGADGADGGSGLSAERREAMLSYRPLGGVERSAGPGGAGAPGGRGGDGGSGGDGQTGGSVEVVATPAPAPPGVAMRLKVLVRELGSSRSQRFLVDAPGSVHVDIQGGQGGAGGHGGQGGLGGPGGRGLPGGQGGVPGVDGAGGSGGKGGAGGRVVVRFPPDIAPWISIMLHFTASGGSGGKDGKSGSGPSGRGPGSQWIPITSRGHWGARGEPGPEPELRPGPVDEPW
jgi:hypothetical protein